jgi:proteasome activator subunit 4
MEALYDLLTKATATGRAHDSIMDDSDDMSGADTPVLDEGAEATFDGQAAVLQSYLDALPYACESVAEMEAELARIVGRICVCAEARNWLVLSTWDGLLQWYVPPALPPPRV